MKRLIVRKLTKDIKNATVEKIIENSDVIGEISNVSSENHYKIVDILKELNVIKPKIEENTKKIEALKGAIYFIGKASNSKEDLLDSDGELANQFIQENKERQPIYGDVILSNDDYLLIYTTVWSSFGKINIDAASTTKEGLVKLGQNEGELIVEESVAKIKGWNELKQSIEEKLVAKLDVLTFNSEKEALEDKIEELNTNKADKTEIVEINEEITAINEYAESQNEKIEKNKKDITQINKKIESISNESIGDLESSAVEGSTVVEKLDNLKNSTVDLTSSQTISGAKKFQQPIETKGIELNSDEVTRDYYVLPKNDGTINLKFYKDEKITNIDLGQESKLTGIKEPEDNFDAVNKKYVDAVNVKTDNAIKKAQEATTLASEVDKQHKNFVSTDYADTKQKATSAYTKSNTNREDIDNIIEQLNHVASKESVAEVNKRADKHDEEITGLSVRLIGYTNRVEVNTEQIGYIYEILGTMHGSIVIIGRDEEHTKDQLLHNNGTLANQFVQNTKKRAPKIGDMVISSDEYAISFNGESWMDLGLFGISLASTTEAGAVKLSTASGCLIATGNDGTVKVSGWDELVEKVNKGFDQSGFEELESGLKAVKLEVQTNKLGIALLNETKASVSSVEVVDNKIGDLATTTIEGETVTTQLKNIALKLEELGSSEEVDLTEINEKLESLESNKLDKATYTVDKTAIEQNIQNVGTKLQQNVEKVNTLEQTVNTNKKAFDTFKTNEFNPLKNKVDTSVVELTEKIEENKNVFDTFKTSEFTPLKNKVDGLGTNLTGITEKVNTNEEKINALEPKVANNEEQISTINEKLNTLKRRLVLVGTSTKNTKEQLLAENGKLANQFVQTTLSRAKEIGDCILSKDNYLIIFDNTNWANYGLFKLDVANGTNAGVIKLGTNEDELELVDATGKVRVRGFAVLKATVNNKADDSKVERINTELTQKIEELTQTTNSKLDTKLDKETHNTFVSDDYTPTKNQVNKNKQDIATINEKLETVAGSEDLEELRGQVESNTSSINEINSTLGTKADKTELEPIKENITTLDNTTVKLTGNQNVDGTKTFRDLTQIKEVEIGFGIDAHNPIKFTSDEGTKTLTFNNRDKILNLDLQNKSNLTGIKTPTNDTDAANKTYVDNKVSPKLDSSAFNEFKSGEFNTVKEKANSNESSINDIREEITNLATNEKIAEIEEKIETKLDKTFETAKFNPVKAQVEKNKTDIQTINTAIGDINETGILGDDIGTQLTNIKQTVDALPTNEDIEPINEAVQNLNRDKLDKTEFESYKEEEINPIKEKLPQIDTNKQEITSIKSSLNNVVTLDGEQRITGYKIYQNQQTFQNIQLGFGVPTSNTVKITPDDRIKTLTFNNGTNNSYFNLDLQNKSNLTGLKDPVNETDAVNKRTLDTVKNKVDSLENNSNGLVERVTTLENTTIPPIKNKAESADTLSKQNKESISTINNTLATKADTETVNRINSQVNTNKDNIDGLGTKITSAEESIRQNTTSIEGINNKLNALSGRIIIIGRDEENSKEQLLDDSGAKANAFVQEHKSRPAEMGDVIISNDKYVVYYNGEEWLDLGLMGVSIATSTTAGIIKLGSAEGELEVIDAQGKVKVKGWDFLKGQVESKAEKTTLESTKRELQSSITANTQKISQIETNKADKSSVEEVKTSIGDLESTGVAGESVAEQLKQIKGDITNLPTSSTVEDLKGKVTKLESDKLDKATYEEEKTAITSQIEELEESLNTTKQEVTANKEEFTTFKSDEFTPVKEKANSNESKINTINSKMVTLADRQTISGQKTFTSSLIFSNVYLGKGITGSTPVRMMPDTGRKTLVFNNGTNDNAFDINLQDRTRLSGIKEPEDPSDAVRKLDLDNVKSSVDRLTQTVNINKGEVDSLKTNVEELTETVETNKGEFDKLTQTVNTNKGEVDKLTQKVNSNKAEFDRLTETVNSNNAEVVKLKSTVETNKEEVDALTQTVTNNKDEVDRLTQTVNSNKNAFDTFKTDEFTPLKNKVDTIEPKIGDIESTGFEGEDIASQLTEIKSSLDNMSTNETIEAINGEITKLKSEKLDKTVYNSFISSDYTPTKNKVNEADSLSKQNKEGLVQANEKITANEQAIETINSTIATKVDTSVFTPVKEQSDSNKTKIEQLERTDTTHTEQISEINSKIDKLAGRVALIGRCDDYNKDQLLDSEGELANQFVQDTKSRPAEMGDLIISNDDYELYYDGTEWLNIGRKTIPIANTSTAGVIKLGTSNGELEDSGDGKAKVVGWDYLQGQVNSKANTSSVEELQTTVQSNSTEISNIKSQYAKKATNERIEGEWRFNNYWTLFKSLSLGNNDGDRRIMISPTTERPIIDLYFGSGADNYFNINLEGRSGLTGLKEPTNNNDAVRKIDLDTVSNESVKLTGNQNVGGRKTFTDLTTIKNLQLSGSGSYIYLTSNSGSKNAILVDGEKVLNLDFKDRARIINLPPPDTGKEPARKIDLENLQSQMITTNTEQTIDARKIFQRGITLGRDITLGYGSPQEFLFTTDERTKTAKLSDGTNKVLNLDLVNKSRIYNVPLPESDGDILTLGATMKTSMFMRKMLPKDVQLHYDTTELPIENKIEASNRYGLSNGDVNFDFTPTRPGDSNILYRIDNATNNAVIIACPRNKVIDSREAECISLHFLFRIPTKTISGNYTGWFPVLKGSSNTNSIFGTARSGLNFNYGSGRVEVEIVSAGSGHIDDFQLDTIYACLIEYKNDRAKLYLNGELKVDLEYSSFNTVKSVVKYGLGSDGNGKIYMLDIGSFFVLHREMTDVEKRNGLKFTGEDMFYKTLV